MMKSAENHLGRGPPPHPWSLELQYASACMKFWKYSLKQRLTGLDYSHILEWAEAGFISNVLDISTMTVTQARKEEEMAKAEFRQSLKDEDL